MSIDIKSIGRYPTINYQPTTINAMTSNAQSTSSFHIQYNIDRIRNTISRFYEDCEARDSLVSRNAQQPTQPFHAEEKTDDVVPPTPPKKDYRGNQYDLDQFNYRQSQIHYYATLAKNKKQVSQVEKVAVEFNSDAFDKRRYLKKWHRVDDYAKQVVVKQYIDKLLSTERISITDHQNLVKETRKLIQTKSLKRVDYDEQTGTVYGVEQLNLPSIR